MVGARMVYFGLPDKKIWGIPAIKLTVLFVWLDVTCFIVQLAGGAMLSSSDPKIASIAMKIYTAGVSLQLGFVTIFIVMMGSFYRLMYKTTRGQIGPLQFLIWAVLAVLGLIVVSVPAVPHLYPVCDMKLIASRKLCRFALCSDSSNSALASTQTIS